MVFPISMGSGGMERKWGFGPLFFAIVGLGAVMGTPAVAATAADMLGGHWLSECTPVGKNGRHGLVTRLEVLGTQIIAEAQLYAQSSCQTPTAQTRYAGRLVESRFDGDSLVFEHQVETLELMPLSDQVAAYYNADTNGAGCGLVGWQPDVAMGVAGRECGSLIFAPAGATLYERAWIHGDAVRFGALPLVWNNLSAELRPEQPAMVVFHKGS